MAWGQMADLLLRTNYYIPVPRLSGWVWLYFHARSLKSLRKALGQLGGIAQTMVLKKPESHFPQGSGRQNWPITAENRKNRGTLMLTTLISKFQTAKNLGWIDFGREIAKIIGLREFWDNFSYFYFKMIVTRYNYFVASGKNRDVEGNHLRSENESVGRLQERSPSKNIFVYWHQGFDVAPEVVKTCRLQIGYITKKQGLNLIELNYENLKSYIDIPWVIEKRLRDGTISLAHYSDYVRTKLILMYGGMWVDSTLFFSDLISPDIFEHELFLFRFRKNTSQHSSNQLIYAVSSGNEILRKMVSFLEYYWTSAKRPESYFFYHYIFSVFASQGGLQKDGIESMHYSENNHYCYEEFLKSDWTSMKSLNFSKSFVHKLTYKDNNTERHAALLRLLRHYVSSDGET
ncbi:hypothetical protein B9057_15040 (plasmid) [Aestuarium zhoushanense]|nr:hypothetical protein B9057_15040 [Aestuarium zhoushanense]